MGIFDESFSSVDLAKIFGVHRVTITNWVKRGALKAVRTPGGRYRVTKKDLRGFLQEREMPVPAFLDVEDKTLVVAVDDEEPVIALLKTIFSTEDMPYLYKFEPFTNPVEAALFIGEQKPDLVLLDLIMPEPDGFKLAGKIKQVSPDTKIIVMTGYATEENLDKLKQYSIDALLTKPFNYQGIKKAIDKVFVKK
ncbi:MAG: response regulator [Pseudomonadota bacterium]